MTCGNRTTLTGECMIGCGGFGGCKLGHEKPLPSRNGYNPLTGQVSIHNSKLVENMTQALSKDFLLKTLPLEEGWEE
jgi:hypothetical protein